MLHWGRRARARSCLTGGSRSIPFLARPSPHGCNRPDMGSVSQVAPGTGWWYQCRAVASHRGPRAELHSLCLIPLCHRDHLALPQLGNGRAGDSEFRTAGVPRPPLPLLPPDSPGHPWAGPALPVPWAGKAPLGGQLRPRLPMLGVLGTCWLLGSCQPVTSPWADPKAQQDWAGFPTLQGGCAVSPFLSNAPGTGGRWKLVFVFNVLPGIFPQLLSEFL